MKAWLTKKYKSLQYKRPIRWSTLSLVVASCLMFVAENNVLFSPESIACVINNLIGNPNSNCPTSVDRLYYYYAAFLMIVITSIIKTLRYFTNKNENLIDYNFKKDLWDTEICVFGRNLSLTEKDRVTLYFYIRKSDSFYKVSRWSPNPDFQSQGRRLYKDGVLKKAYRDTINQLTIQSDYYKQRKSYIAEVVKESEMSERDVENLTMKSRVLYGHRVEKINGDAVGVILIESEEADFGHIKHKSIRCDSGDEVREVELHLNAERLKLILARECKRLAYFIDNYQVPGDIFEFEEAQVI